MEACHFGGRAYGPAGGARERAGRGGRGRKGVFRGKTVRIVVGSGVGGGYDVYARLTAPYLSRALDATVVVENQPALCDAA